MRLLDSSCQARKFYKIVVIADSSVDKSQLIARYVETTSPLLFTESIGIDYRVKELVYNDVAIKLQIWDTAGQERFVEIADAFLRGSHGVLLVYDVGNQESFNYASRWLDAINNQTSLGAVCVVGHHCLTQDRKIATEQGQALAKQYNVDFLETSEQSLESIDFAFQSFVIQLEDPDALRHHQEERTIKLAKSFEEINHKIFLKVQQARLFPIKLAIVLSRGFSLPGPIIMKVLDYIDTYPKAKLTEVRQILYDSETKKAIVDLVNNENWTDVKTLCQNAIKELGEGAHAFYQNRLERAVRELESKSLVPGL